LSGVVSTAPRELLAGCWELRPRVHDDARGRFVKPYLRSALAELGERFDIAELYYSVSRAGSLRGLHLQVPPHSLRKLVFATAGEVFDVILDLRAGSPTRGQHRTLTLSAEAGNVLLVDHGVAHGFCVPSGTATVAYAVTTEYAPDDDTGVRWNSAGIAWPVDDPIVSPRDAALPTLDEFLARHG
jgi:dTDP-4-dehydrorhamnose 3,5-epimerase